MRSYESPFPKLIAIVAIGVPPSTRVQAIFREDGSTPRTRLYTGVSAGFKNFNVFSKGPGILCTGRGRTYLLYYIDLIKFGTRELCISGFLPKAFSSRDTSLRAFHS